MTRTVRLLLVMGALSILGCGDGSKPTTAKPLRPESLEASRHPEVFPVADGGAYVVGRHQGPLWYVREHHGTKVEGLPDGTFLSEIIPAADGGAYLATGNGLWYLKGAGAKKVTETATPQKTSDIPPKEKWLWALLQIERVRAQRAADAAVNDDATSYEPPVDAYDYVR